MDAQFATLVLTAASGGCLVGALRCIPVKAFKRGGLRFLRVGRLQFVFCICRESI
jgi:hypothetical protein